MSWWMWTLVGVGVGVVAVLVLLLGGRGLNTVLSEIGEAEAALASDQRDRALGVLGKLFCELGIYHLEPPDVGRVLAAMAGIERILGWTPERDYRWRGWKQHLEAIRETGGKAPDEYALWNFLAHVRYHPLLAVCEGAGDEQLVPLMEELIRAGADVNQNDVMGDAPIMAAAGRGHLEAVRLLVEAGADINHRGWTYSPLSLAEGNGCWEVAEYLATRGAERWDAEAPPDPG